MEFRINEIFQVDQKIGAGSFSEVFIGKAFFKNILESNDVQELTLLLRKK